MKSLKTFEMNSYSQNPLLELPTRALIPSAVGPQPLSYGLSSAHVCSSLWATASRWSQASDQTNASTRTPELLLMLLQHWYRGYLSEKHQYRDMCRHVIISLLSSSEMLPNFIWIRYKTNLCEIKSDKKLETSHITLWICWFLFVLIDILFKSRSCCFRCPSCAVGCAGAWTMRNSALRLVCHTLVSHGNLSVRETTATCPALVWCCGERRPTQVLWQKEWPVWIIPGLAALSLTRTSGLLPTLPISHVSKDKCYWEIIWFYILTV